MAKKSRKFKTDVQQLLDLVTHSLYSKKEIFLRELISNASDAIDRVQFEALTNKKLLGKKEQDWKIKITPDKDAGTLTISDNGIGMTVEELETNIGTIANSGTRRFLEELQKNKKTANAEFIGQFGVGFYASFMVADKVTVITKRAGSDEPAVRWTSDGAGTYTMEDADKEERGTDVILHMREDMDNFLAEYEIRRIVTEYSDYISYPVSMDITRTTKGENEGDEEVTTTEEEALNSMKAIWKKMPAEVSEEEYNEFYKHVSHDYTDPLKVIHYRAEGTAEFQALLYLPAQAPMDLFWPDAKRGLHLYVKNVFINEDCEELLPSYLRFLKGVVDSSDLPLNVSREMLQDDVVIRRIRKSLVTRVLKELADLKKRTPEKFQTFYENFGVVIKEGVHQDFENYDKLKELLLFASSKSEEGKPVSLKDYVARMPEKQKEIYYLTAASLAQAATSPHLEALRDKDYEVLFFVDAIDEWVAQRLTEYDGKKLKAIDRGDIDIHTDEEKAEKDEALKGDAETYKPVIEAIQKHLEEEIQEVKLSTRLTDSACCLVADEMGMNANMERIMKAMNQEMPPVKRVLELNPKHPIMPKLLAALEKDAESSVVADYAELLYDQALLTEGSPIKDPAHFGQLVSKLMVEGLG
ncbi:MAG: molecular chaperone HtpG [Kiritimatiellae bacterium]|nr:molecular chaperone HtpG [Kiritimatiellia bacterium]